MHTSDVAHTTCQSRCALLPEWIAEIAIVVIVSFVATVRMRP